EPVRQGGFAEARMRRRDQAAPAGEPFGERLPRIVALPAMQEENRARAIRTGVAAAAALEDFKIDAGDLHCCCIHTPSSRCHRSPAALVLSILTACATRRADIGPRGRALRSLLHGAGSHCRRGADYSKLWRASGDKERETADLAVRLVLEICHERPRSDR